MEVANKQKTISWEALEHAYYEKSSDWYWIVGTVGITLAILALVFGNIILSILLIIATGSMLLHGARVPGIIKIELLPKGVRVGNNLYPYSQIKAFSLNEEHDPPILVLDSRALLAPDINVFIEKVTPEEVRDYLLDHLDEKYHEPSAAEGLIHYLGF